MKKNMLMTGVASVLLLAALGTTALAVSGQVTFNASSIVLDGETKIAAGTTVTAPNGQQVPGSILYTDAAGGKTHYLPVRAVSELLGVEVGYDPAAGTVYLGDQPEAQAASAGKWHREVEGRQVTYVCGEEGNRYDTPPLWRPAWTAEGWGLAEISSDTRSYTAAWRCEGPEGRISFQFAWSSTAGFGRQMSGREAVENCRKLTVRGYEADYYQDGKSSLLVWEDKDGILFWLSGTDVSTELLMEAAESLEPCTAAETYSLSWLPKGYTQLDDWTIADSGYETWLCDGVGMTWLYSPGPVAVPDGTPEIVTVNGGEARFWAAEEPWEDTGEETVPPGLNGITISTGTLPGVHSRDVNALVWTKNGVNFRLQSVLDRDTMLRIAEHVERR